MEDFPYELETIYNDLEVTKVRIHNGSKSEKSLAYVDIIFNDCFKITKVEVRKTAKGTIEVLMPYRRDVENSRTRLDFAHPLDKELHKMLKKVILWSYKRFCETGNTVFQA